jgi:hypothetical protein
MAAPLVLRSSHLDLREQPERATLQVAAQKDVGTDGQSDDLRIVVHTGLSKYQGHNAPPG